MLLLSKLGMNWGLGLEVNFNHRYGPIATAVARYSHPQTNIKYTFYEWNTGEVPVLNSKLKELQSKSQRVRYIIIRLVRFLVKQCKKEDVDLLNLSKSYIHNCSAQAANSDLKNLLEDIGTFYSFEIAQTVQRLLIGGGGGS
jgi:hypothetical protein